MGFFKKVLMIILLLVLLVIGVFIYLNYGTITDDEAKDLNYKTLNDLTNNQLSAKAVGYETTANGNIDINKTIDKIFDDKIFEGMATSYCQHDDFAMRVAKDPMLSLSTIPNRGKASNSYPDDVTYRGELEYALIRLHTAKNLMITMSKRDECINSWITILKAYSNNNAFSDQATAQGYLEGLFFVLQILGQMCVLKQRSPQSIVMFTESLPWLQSAVTKFSYPFRRRTNVTYLLTLTAQLYIAYLSDKPIDGIASQISSNVTANLDNGFIIGEEYANENIGLHNYHYMNALWPALILIKIKNVSFPWETLRDKLNKVVQNLTNKDNNTAKIYNEKYKVKNILGLKTEGQKELYDYIYTNKLPVAVNLPIFMVLAEELIKSLS